MAHAMAFKRKLTYSGACDMEKRVQSGRLRAHVRLLRAMGLSAELRIHCPNNSTFVETMDRKEYNIASEQLWTPEWRASMAPILRNHTVKSSNETKVVVHIRRGDITPCSKRSDFRCLPNSHYVQVLEKYVNDSKAKITIFSEKRSFQPWSHFENKSNIDLQLDTNVENVWRGMQTADILILSKSSFSFVPAILNLDGNVIYTPFWHDPLPHWTIVDEAIVNKSAAEVQQLKKALC